MHPQTELDLAANAADRRRELGLGRFLHVHRETGAGFPRS